MNTFEIIGLKKKIDDALVRIAEDVGSRHRREESIMICYHDHYDNPTFSIFTHYDTATQDSSCIDNVDFKINLLVDEDIARKIIEEILAEMKKDIE